jgi:endonuclease VIII
MPEGPTIYAVRDDLKQFEGQKVLEVSGTAKMADLDTLQHDTLTIVRSWGKHLLLTFGKRTIKIHFLMFGSYRVNEERKAVPKLTLVFRSGYVNFYAGQVKWLEDTPDKVYDWSADIMNKKWSPSKALKKVQAHPESMICDLLMDQSIFSGVGNIIKSESLFRAGIHPESKAGEIPLPKVKKLIRDAKDYTFEFLAQKFEGTLSKNWKVYTKKKCPVCKEPITKKITGKTHRRSFYCERDQKLYD